MLFVLMRSRASHEKIITQNFAKEFHSRRGFIGAIAFHLAELKECRAVILFIETLLGRCNAICSSASGPLLFRLFWPIWILKF